MKLNESITYKDFYKEILETLETERAISPDGVDHNGVHGGKYGIGHDGHRNDRTVDNTYKMKLFNSKKKDIQTYSESEGREIGKNTSPAIDHSIFNICDHMNVKGVKEAEDYIKRCVVRGAIYSLMNHIGVKPSSDTAS
jgi:hypothetical protein